MTNPRVSLLHLACGLAGWGVVTGLRPLVTAPSHSLEAVEAVTPAKTNRQRLNAAGGQRVLERLSRGMPPEVFGGYYQTLNGDSLPLSAFSHFSAVEIEILREETIIRSVDQHLRSFDGTDLEYAFRHGRINAQQIHDLLAGRMPGDAEKPVFRSAIYKRLAVLDPVAAEVLLTPYSVEDATDLKHDAISSFLWSNPSNRLTKSPAEGLLSLVRSISRSDNPAINGQLQNSWELAVQFYHDRYGSDFLEWVEQLPSGSARDQATASLLRRMDYADADEFNRLRGLIQDPTIREGFAPR